MGRKKSDISEMDIVEKLNSPFPIALNALIKEHDNARELMEHLGISPQAVNQYRNGLSRPSLENICKIADVYNVSVDYLYLSFNRDSGKPIMVFHTEDIMEVRSCLKSRGYTVL